LRRRLSVLAVVLLLGAAAGAQSVTIERDGNAFKVVGWEPPATPPTGGWRGIFSVRVDGIRQAEPLLGTYSVENHALVFRPQYPLAAGVGYVAVFVSPRGTINQVFKAAPRSLTATTRVEHVYPSADVLPSNQLRLYIYFSSPMSRGEAARRIHMLDADGKELTALFLPGEELWDPMAQRLTMTFDPGRIKRGLTSNEKMGPPIAEGQRYTLVVDREWPDARGLPIVETYSKTFRGGPPVRTPLDEHAWHVTPPRAGTSDPLVIDFGRPMNYPLLLRMLQVAGPRGRVDGGIDVARSEQEWRLSPRAPWQPGSYRIVADTALEDVAGNRIGQPFDIDVFDRVTEHITTGTVAIPFTVK
jgi:hypothetical protein